MHQDHDLALIAGLAVDDLTNHERTRAQAQLDGCAECRTLHLDLIAIAQATRALPPAPAPRDFRITAEQAARLRRTGWLARLLGPIAGARSVARPLATTFTTLGLVGVLVAAAVPGLMGGAASMAAPEAAPGVAGAPGPVASAAPDFQFGPMATSGAEDQTTKDGIDASAEPLVGTSGGGVRNSGADGTDDGRLDDSTGPGNPLLVGSIAFLGVGLALFGLRFAGRRLH